MKHIFASPPTQILFPGREGLLQGLGDAKIAVCFPASITHPERGSIESITPRYFEAMASGCLVVGHCPAELLDLIGYNPVIQVELDRAAEQVTQILSNIEIYQPLVLKNLATVRESGTWVHRAQAVKQILESENSLFIG